MTVYQRARDLMDADLGDEIVALDTDRGHCFGFNSVASSTWKLLAEPRTFDELRDRLLDEYDVGTEQCSEDLRALLADLSAKQLIVER